MHLILTGGTGLVGSGVLSHILSLPASQVSRLSILGRKAPPLLADRELDPHGPQVEVITHSDFSSYPPELLSKLKGADGVVWALGISQNEVSKEEYIKITKDYTLEAAKAFSTLNEKKLNFVYVSGEGATLKPGMFSPIFARVKGETEAALVELAKQEQYHTLRVYSARPAFVDALYQPDVYKVYRERQTGLKHRLLIPILGPPIRTFWPNNTSPTKELGEALTSLAMGDGEPLTGKGIDAQGEGRTLSNVALRRLAGLSH